MVDERAKFMFSSVKNSQQGMDLMDKLVAVAQPSAVYGQPFTVGDLTFIPVAEVRCSLGFGFASGCGPAGTESDSQAKADESAHPATPYGGGGGGGGVSTARPVAIIGIGQSGVCTIQPVFDATQVAIAAIAAMFSIMGMIGMMGKLRRHRHWGQTAR